MGWNFSCPIAEIWPSLALYIFFRFSNLKKKRVVQCPWFFVTLAVPSIRPPLLLSHRVAASWESRAAFEVKGQWAAVASADQKRATWCQNYPPLHHHRRHHYYYNCCCLLSPPSPKPVHREEFRWGGIGGWVHRHSKLCLALLATKLAALSCGRHVDKLLHSRGVGTVAPL